MPQLLDLTNQIPSLFDLGLMREKERVERQGKLLELRMQERAGLIQERWQRERLGQEYLQALEADRMRETGSWDRLKYEQQVRSGEATLKYGRDVEEAKRQEAVKARVEEAKKAAEEVERERFAKRVAGSQPGKELAALGIEPRDMDELKAGVDYLQVMSALQADKTKAEVAQQKKSKIKALAQYIFGEKLPPEIEEGIEAGFVDTLSEILALADPMLKLSKEAKIKLDVLKSTLLKSAGSTADEERIWTQIRELLASPSPDAITGGRMERQSIPTAPESIQTAAAGKLSKATPADIAAAFDALGGTPTRQQVEQWLNQQGKTLSR